MTFEEAAMIMMGGGGRSPVTPSPLSLEGIKALKTLATMTVGDFVFEIKEPKIFYAGAIYTTSDGAVMNSAWTASEVINGSVAVVGSGNVATEYFAWGNYTDNDGSPRSTYFNSYSDFAVTAVNPTVYDSRLPNVSVSFSYKQSSGYDGIVSYTRSQSGSAYLYGQSSNDVKFTNLTPDEYFEFIKSYCAAAAVNTPVIKIL